MVLLKAVGSNSKAKERTNTWPIRMLVVKRFWKHLLAHRMLARLFHIYINTSIHPFVLLTLKKLYH